MRINSVNNLNVTAITDDNKQATQQVEQSSDVVSQERTSSFIKKKKKSEAEKLEEMQSMYKEVMRQLETANAQAKAQKDAIEVRIKCLKIAISIMCGDNVSKEDHKYLLENDAALYGRAIMMRMEKENPKELKRISEDEENAVEVSSGESGSVESAGIEAVQTGSGEAQAEASGDSTASSE